MARYGRDFSDFGFPDRGWRPGGVNLFGPGFGRRETPWLEHRRGYGADYRGRGYDRGMRGAFGPPPGRGGYDRPIGRGGYDRPMRGGYGGDFRGAWRRTFSPYDRGYGGPGW